MFVAPQPTIAGRDPGQRFLYGNSCGWTRRGDAWPSERLKTRDQKWWHHTYPMIVGEKGPGSAALKPALNALEQWKTQDRVQALLGASQSTLPLAGDHGRGTDPVSGVNRRRVRDRPAVGSVDGR